MGLDTTSTVFAWNLLDAAKTVAEVTLQLIILYCSEQASRGHSSSFQLLMRTLLRRTGFWRTRVTDSQRETGRGSRAAGLPSCSAERARGGRVYAERWQC